MNTTTGSENWDPDTVTWDRSTVWTSGSSLEDYEVKEAEKVKKGFRAKKGVYVKPPFWARSSGLTGQGTVLQERHSQSRPSNRQCFLLQYKRLSKGGFNRKYQRVRRKRKRRLF